MSTAPSVRPRRASWSFRLAALASVAAGSFACSAILGLDPPEQDTADGGAALDSSIDAGDDAGDASADTGGSLPEDAGPLTCAPVDLVVEAGGASITYLPLVQGPTPDGSAAWQFFDTSTVVKGARSASFSGGTFDGRYVYIPSRGTDILRYDTQSGLDFAAGWDFFNTASLAPGAPDPGNDGGDGGDAGDAGDGGDAGAGLYSGGFSGAVSDGTFVYFIPNFVAAGGVRTSQRVLVRFDPRVAATSTFKNAAAWTLFDLGTLDDAGALNSGFLGGTYDGRYLYLAPSNDGSPDGRVLRYDTTAGGGGPGFTSPSSWATFDLSAAFTGGGVGTAAGFAGAVFDGTSVYFVPEANDAFDGGLHNGNSSFTARLNSVSSAFADAKSWTVFDLTLVSGAAYNFFGGAYDGERYVYYAPRSGGVAVRFDTRMPTIATASAWSYYDVQRVVPSDGGPGVDYAGAAFDGRFVTFLPAGAGFGTILRYDTRSSFGADCAWSSLDLTTVDSGLDAGNFNFAAGAVFDGQYLYVVPAATGVVARFLVRTSTAPLALPHLPAFHGSFL